MKIPSFVWIGAILLLGGGFLLLLSSTRNNNDKIFAKAGLPVFIEVFSDYNCQHCADFTPFVEDVQATFGDKVSVAKRQSPFLTDSSYGYAYSAEAARLQNKFEEFNHGLFAWVAYQKSPSNTTFEYSDEDKAFYSNEINVKNLAERLQLDVDKFEIDRKSSSVVNVVQSEKSDLVKRAGTVSTPAVFIYGEIYNMSTYEDLKVEVQKLITKAETELENEAK